MLAIKKFLFYSLPVIAIIIFSYLLIRYWNSLMANQALSNAFGAALGTFIGIIIFFCFRWIYYLIKNRPRVIKTYFCYNNLNYGQPDQTKGELTQHHGKGISNESEYKIFKAKNPIWEWTRDQCGHNPQKGNCIIYGPYSSDCPTPGNYSANFRIKVIGLPEIKQENDSIILELDVDKTITKLIPVTKNNRLGQLSTSLENPEIQNVMGRIYIKASDIINEKWNSYSVKFYSDGSGVWEYRIFAYDGESRDPDNLEKYEDKVRIFFDKIEIKSHEKFDFPS